MDAKETFTYEGKTYRVFMATAYGQKWQLILLQKKYVQGGGLAVEIYDICHDYAEEGEAPYPEPLAAATVNLGVAFTGEHAFIDTNNYPWLPEFLKEHGLAEPTGASARSGFCEYPLYKWNTDKFTVQQ